MTKRQKYLTIKDHDEFGCHMVNPLNQKETYCGIAVDQDTILHYSTETIPVKKMCRLCSGHAVVDYLLERKGK